MKKGQETRERILARAARLFNEKGYYGVSLTDLMKATGLQKGGLYNHFESKEKLALEAFEYSAKRVYDRFDDALAGKRASVERLLAIVHVMGNYAVDPPVPGGCPILNTAVESDDGNPQLRARARKAMEDWRNLLRRIVSKGMERGEIRRIDADEFATFFIATIEGGIMLSKLYGNPVHLARVAEHLKHYIETELRL
ncbi:MAG TPA: TetR/AcrR family transcriptional regulator [Bryobacteraceae bacterium]|nr:TetR/AcrR family transcriptional regulator [Bryobacteraceae bacterium]